MKEGGLIAGIGGVIGLGGGVIYAWLLMAGLRTWWLAAVGTPFLFLHINPLSLVLGYLIALVVVLFSIGWTVRQFGKVPIPALICRGIGRRWAFQSKFGCHRSKPNPCLCQLGDRPRSDDICPCLRDYCFSWNIFRQRGVVTDCGVGFLCHMVYDQVRKWRVSRESP